MIRHIVLLQFRADVSDENKQQLYAELAALRSVLAGIVGFAAGGNLSPEGFGRGYDDGFVVDFETSEARDRYLDHPQHQRVGAALVDALEGGTQGLLVFDMDVG